MSPRRERKWVELPSRSNARIAADVQAELEGWIDERATELRAMGMTADEAQSQARREFGDRQSAQRTCVEDDRALERRSRLTRLVGELRELLVRVPLLGVELFAAMRILFSFAKKGEQW